MATNRLRHFNGCSIEELEPSHLQPRDECPAIDGLSCCGVGTCGHMRPPSKGWSAQRNPPDATAFGGLRCADPPYEMMTDLVDAPLNGRWPRVPCPRRREHGTRKPFPLAHF